MSPKQTKLIVATVISGVVLLLIICGTGVSLYIHEIYLKRVEQKHAEAREVFKQEWEDFFADRDTHQKTKNTLFDEQRSGTGGLQGQLLEIRQTYFNRRWIDETQVYESYARNGFTVTEALKEHPVDSCLPEH